MKSFHLEKLKSKAGGMFDAEAPPTNVVCFVLTTC